MTEETSISVFNDEINMICDQVDTIKSSAFPRWICQNVLNITEEYKIDEAISIGGKNDYGIDIFHADESGDITEQYVCWIQAKFSEDLNRVINREELETFANTLNHLKNCPDLANNTFKQKSAEFIQINQKHPHIRKRMIFAVTGKLNDQAQALIDNPAWMKEKFGQGVDSVELEILDLQGILSRMMIQRTPAIGIKFDGGVLERTDTTTGKKSISGYVRADELVKIVKKHREQIFLENPRESLGKTAPTHKAILETLADATMKNKFWKLNNGITATCSGFKDMDDSTYSIDNFKVVNGRQTTYTLANSIYPIDDVFLPMTIHDAVDDHERNQISETTNTQNPIKPVDLISNYPEIKEMVLQCRKNFKDFYFERQTNGFQMEDTITKKRVTLKRVMKKDSIARAYYAYAVNPNDAMISDKILFSVSNNKQSHYFQIFASRDIKELIIPHIFMQMLNELHRKWCQELKDNPSEKMARDKGIISKDIVKYYILRFIHESMFSIDETDRKSIEEKLIEIFRNIGKKDKLPDSFINIANIAYNIFMLCYDADRNDTWPPELLKKIKAKNYKEEEHDVPSPYDIMYMLKQNGINILPHLLRMRQHFINQIKDKVQFELRNL